MNAKGYSRAARRGWALLLAALATMAAATAGHAATLGRVMNNAHVGRPLNVAVDLKLEGADAATTAGLCVSAEAYYGEARVAGTSVSVQRAGSGAVVRVRNSAAVNEPVVTVYVTADCTSPVTKKFTLLAEAPLAPRQTVEEAPRSVVFQDDYVPPPPTAPEQLSDTELEARAAAAAARRAERAERRAKAAAAAKARRAARAQAAASTAELDPWADMGGAAAVGLASSGALSINAPTPGNAAGNAMPPATAPGETVVAETAPAAGGKPRLELDGFEWTLKDPGLRSSYELSFAPEGDPAAREAARAQWAALNSQGVGVLAGDADPGAAQQDFITLTEKLKNQDREIAALRAQLVKAQKGSSLGAMLWWPLGLLAGLGALGWVWLRRRDKAEQKRKAEKRKEIWWQNDAGAQPSADAVAAAAADMGEKLNYRSKVLPRGGYDRADLPVPEVHYEDTSPPSEFPEFGLSRVEAVDGQEFEYDSDKARTASTEELFDVQQQADFFLALGQHDQAIAILSNHIAEQPKTSPLAYLDLLGIYHATRREGDFEELRTRFNRLFNAKVANFADYKVDSVGLESYEKVITRLQQLWGTPKVIDLIEESVFRRAGRTDDEAFDPLAYRELLMLYGIAVEVSEAPGDLYRLKTVIPEIAFDGSSTAADMDAISLVEPEEVVHRDFEEATELTPLTAAPASKPAARAGGAAQLQPMPEIRGQETNPADFAPSTLDFDLDLPDLPQDFAPSEVDFDLTEDSKMAPLERPSTTPVAELDVHLDSKTPLGLDAFSRETPAEPSAKKPAIKSVFTPSKRR